MSKRLLEGPNEDHPTKRQKSDFDTPSPVLLSFSDFPLEAFDDIDIPTPSPISPGPDLPVQSPLGLDPDSALCDNRLSIQATGQFPEDSPTISWSGGYSTKAPVQWNSTEIEEMASAPDAFSDEAAPGEIPIVKITLPPELQDPNTTPEVHDSLLFDLTSRIRQILSSNKLVVVKGWKPDVIVHFTLPGIENFKGTLRHKVEWQDGQAIAEGKSKIHKLDDLKEFVSQADNPAVCWNLLDLPSLRSSVPFFIEALSDDTRAWEMNHHSENIADPKSMRFSTWKSQSWDLLTHGGFFTDTHHDANGYCTYVYGLDGAKIWGPIFLKLNQEQATHGEVLESMRAFLENRRSKEASDLAKAYTILLEASDVLIQPPGLFHEVYTPIKSIFRGGHFYTYDTMHLTEVSRAFDHKHAQIATNAHHDCAHRTLCRMALALSQQSRDLPLRPILALAQMILHESDYRPQILSGQKLSKSKQGDKLQREENLDNLAAKRVMQKIISDMLLSKEDLKRTVQVGGGDWCFPGKEVLKSSS